MQHVAHVAQMPAFVPITGIVIGALAIALILTGAVLSIVSSIQAMRIASQREALRAREEALKAREEALRLREEAQASAWGGDPLQGLLPPSAGEVEDLVEEIFVSPTMGTD